MRWTQPKLGGFRLPLAAGTPLRTGLLAGAVFAGLSGLVLWQTAYWARDIALSEIRDTSTRILSLVVENLRGEIGKYQYQPTLLAADPLLRGALSPGTVTDDIRRANDALVRFNDVSGSDDTYLVNSRGVIVAASNWNARDSLVGRNVAHRSFFGQAMQGSLGRDFGIDARSDERGYYFAYPIRDGNGIVGAVVLRVGVVRLEPNWLSTSDHRVLVVDGDGVIFLSTHPEWRLRTLLPLSDAVRNRLKLDRTYGIRNLEPLPILSRTAADAWQPGGIVRIQDGPWGDGRQKKIPPSTTKHLLLSQAMNEANWRVLILSDTRGVDHQVRVWVAVAAFMLVSLLLLATNIYQRRRRFEERIALQQTAQAELERQVAERTGDLSEANAQLLSEIAERNRTETQLRETQAELVQATKLAALGQMSAGLSHELNQPLAAIRSYADNARTLLDRDQVDDARSNLGGISELAHRMGRIIRNLRTYARREPAALRPVSARAALDNALGLLESRLAAEKVSVSTSLPASPTMVVGGEVRLQQVFVNLLSNAADAMRETADKTLEIVMDESDTQLEIRISDSGPGVDPAEIDRIFDPFYSTKDVGAGMGLGLSITYGIVRQFDGEIACHNAPGGGAVFVVRLQRALATAEETVGEVTRETARETAGDAA